MGVLIWAGALVALIGLAGLIRCIVLAAQAKRAGLDDNAMRQRLQKLVALNLGALFLSAIGLMMVVIGVILG